MIFEDFANAAIGTGNTLDNSIEGNDSNNKLDGQTGDDTLIGGLGNNILIGGIGNDSLNGGTGVDVMKAAPATTATQSKDERPGQELANGGTDTVRSTVNFTLSANLENLVLLAARTGIGNDFNNVITGSGGADTIQGGKGNDTLFGDSSGDNISGGDGNDLIEGGIGADTLQGGAGNDTFLYRLVNIIDPIGGDVIVGFETGKDKIDLLDLFLDFDINHPIPSMTAICGCRSAAATRCSSSTAIAVPTPSLPWPRSRGSPTSRPTTSYSRWPASAIRSRRAEAASSGDLCGTDHMAPGRYPYRRFRHASGTLSYFI